MFDEIEAKFKEMKPDLVFVEGIIHLNRDRDAINKALNQQGRDEIIRNQGEPCFALNLATEAGVAVECPEPDYAEEISYVFEQGFSKEAIFAYYLYRIVQQYHQIPGDKMLVEEYISMFIPRFQRSTNWDGFDYSIDNLKQIGKTIWGPNGDINQCKFRVDPIPWKSRQDSWTIVNDVCQASSNFREAFILNNIIEATKRNDRIFIVYGQTHAVRQEPALRKYFTEEFR